MDRREFLKLGVYGSAAGVVSGLSTLPVTAGPFEENDYLKIISGDKKLNPDWVRSLYCRGQKQVYSDRRSLEHIGMPVGGLFAGTVYLSGDGRLWLWDIFNRDQEGIRPKTVPYKGQNIKNRDGSNYVEPAQINCPFEQEFGLRLNVNGSMQDVPLNMKGFEKVIFNGQYPQGTVDYESSHLPLKATLKAYSPFIPLNLDDSSLPATLMNYTITNTSNNKIGVDLYGKLQNAICMETRRKTVGRLVNSIISKKDFSAINCSAESLKEPDQKNRIDKLAEQRDYGSMSLAMIGSRPKDYAVAAEGADFSAKRVTGKLEDKLVGTIGTTLTLKPGQSQTVSFAVTWNFPNFYGRGVGGTLVGHSYSTRFLTSLDVIKYIAGNFHRLTSQTEKWVQTWYDSTLPYWLLDRTMANTSTLATTTCYRFRDGRFWAWEGIGCCEGTCTHVWHYAQAPGRIFPEIERIEREGVNFGIGQHADGGIGMRTHLKGSNKPAHDGQCGRILGAYRDHQMSSDDAFLRRIWPNVKKAIEYLIKCDANGDGLIEGAQPNTLDAAWYGKVSFLQSLYIAALRAGQAMAIEMGDRKFADKCERIAIRGAEIIEELYNGEYFIQIEDPAHKKDIGVGPGCYIDQVFGQSWAHQVGLGRIFDKDKQLSALKSLWKYNFVPDVGPFRDRFKQGRWYAMAGDAGLLMCTWPKGGQNPNFEKHWQYMYFNECMSGFEWQVASHMIYEGMLKEGLAISRAIHDRYDALLRNPYNEIECSDHYARAMASYGVFISITGFEYHGPKGHIAFSPRLTPENFKAAFITAEGWGTFSQKRQENMQMELLRLQWGQLTLKQMAFDLPPGKTARKIRVTANSNEVKVTHRTLEKRVMVTLAESLKIQAGQDIEVKIQW
jgi:non-lysosomal glucosylceramidase